jgi:hypothetical protein
MAHLLVALEPLADKLEPVLFVPKGTPSDGLGEAGALPPQSLRSQAIDETDEFLSTRLRRKLEEMELKDSAMSQSKLRELVHSLMARYPKASEGELADYFMEALRNDEALRKTVLEEVFELMSSGLERTWQKK